MNLQKFVDLSGISTLEYFLVHPFLLWMSLQCILGDQFPKGTSDRLGFEIICKTVLISSANYTLSTEDFLFSESLTLNYINNKQLLGLRYTKNKAF